MTDVTKRVLLYACLGAAIYGFAWVNGRASEQAELTFENAAHLLAGHTTATRLQDSLGRVMQGAKAQADSLRAHPHYIQVVTAHHDTVQSVDTVWVNQQVADLNHAYSACSEALTLCRARSDSLEASLRAVLKAKECTLLLGIPCPPRGAFLLAGGILGFVLGSRR